MFSAYGLKTAALAILIVVAAASDSFATDDPDAPAPLSAPPQVSVETLLVQH